MEDANRAGAKRSETLEKIQKPYERERENKIKM